MDSYTGAAGRSPGTIIAIGSNSRLQVRARAQPGYDMADNASATRINLDTEIEQLKRTIEMLREYATGRSVKDGSWSSLERAEERLGELLHLRTQRDQQDG